MVLSLIVCHLSSENQEKRFISSSVITEGRLFHILGDPGLQLDQQQAHAPAQKP